MKNIEVELRSFINEQQYKNLIEHFNKNAQFIEETSQTTYYFDCPQDLRIQKGDTYSKVWLKKGALHDTHREEIEIKVKTEDFEELKKLFIALDYNVEIVWLRNRKLFKWDNIDVTLDYTQGYGYILELEAMSEEQNVQNTLETLKAKFSELNIEVTPKEEFDRQYKYYKENWKSLIDFKL